MRPRRPPSRSRSEGGGRPMTGRERVLDSLTAAVGAAGGGIVGYHIFFWLANQGFYGMMIPGAMLGLGAGLLARNPSQTRGVVLGVAGVLLGLYTEWKFAPFAKDDS